MGVAMGIGASSGSSGLEDLRFSDMLPDAEREWRCRLLVLVGVETGLISALLPRLLRLPSLLSLPRPTLLADLRNKLAE